MQSEEKPLIRPPATFSPYEGEKERDRTGLTLNEIFSTNPAFHAA
jgi:hypothetical protein